uniref:CBFD_NFYB_HMF domain-containing protein n=1 Tax=Panagrellus redivivus TaxID=6233 RepID=A0A7E4UPL6_PANRE
MSNEPTANYVFANTSGGTPAPSSADRGEARGAKQGVILEQDRFMPIANISRIMKAALPPQAKLSKESKECVQECVTEFLLFLTSEASEKCNTERRKTITGDDLVFAMEQLGFDTYLPPIKAFQKRFKEANKIDRQNLEDSLQYMSPKAIETSYSGSVPDSDPSSSAPVAHQVQQGFMVQQIPQQEIHQQHMEAEEMPPQLEPANGNHEVVAAPAEPMQPGPSVGTGIGGLNLRPVTDVYVDPATSQHYIAVHSPGGTSGLIPIELRAVTQSGQQAPTPMSIEAVAEQSNMRQMHR